MVFIEWSEISLYLLSSCWECIWQTACCTLDAWALFSILFFSVFFVFVSLSPSSGSLHFSSSFAPHKKAFIEYKTGNKVTFGSDLALPVGSCWMERLGCARFRKWQMINFVHVFASLLKCFLHVNLPQGQFLFGENMLSIFRCPAITADTLQGYFLQSSVSKL